jgi:hypothetical protein
MIVGLVSVTFLLAGLAIAQDPPAGGDDPPVRLKKKPRPDVEQPKEEDPPKPADPPKEQPKEKDPKAKEPKKEGDEPEQPEQPEMDEAEVLSRVGKNMRSSEDRLDHAELNDATEQVQKDILKDLDSLINQQKNGGGGGGQDQQNQDQQNQNQQNQDNKKKQGGGQAKVGMGKPKGGLKGGQQQQAKGGQGKKPGQGQGQGQPQQAKGGGEKPNQGGGGGGQGQKPQQGQAGNQGGGGGKSEGEPSKLAEVYKDVWGHLPETMRAEMNAYSREQFMAKYNDLIKQYYSSVAEKSRKRD